MLLYNQTTGLKPVLMMLDGLISSTCRLTRSLGFIHNTRERFHRLGQVEVYGFDEQSVTVLEVRIIKTSYHAYNVFKESSTRKNKAISTRKS